MGLLSQDMYQRGQEVGEALQGQCTKTQHDLASEEEVNDPMFNQGLDEVVFCCETCNWWCPRDEESEDEEGVCRECA